MSSSTEKLNSIKIPLEDIKEATNNFSEENLIRHLGKRKIYKGELSRFEKSINIVAVCFDPTSWRRRKEFMKEITMLCSLKHPNLASIVGFCDEKIIVYKLYSKRSLDQHISDPVTLTWTQRLRICLGIARALSYINYDKERNFSVIHGNVKSSKILLDDKWQPKVFGFELSKVQPAARRQGLVLDRLVSGTVAYVDPAYVRLGGVTHKSDVYSFGVVLFEVLCGMKAFVQAEKQYELVNMQGSPSMSVTQARPPSIGDNDHHSRPAISSGDNDYNLESDNDYDPEPEEFGISLVNKTFKFFSPALYFSSDELSDTDEEAIMQTSNSTEKQPIMSHKHLLGYDFSEAEEYLITLKSLEGLHIPEDGLLAKLAKSHYENETLDDIIHPDLRKQMDSRSLKKFSEAAYCCLNEQRAQRPNIDRVIFALEQALELQIAHENSEHAMLAVKGKSTYHLKEMAPAKRLHMTKKENQGETSQSDLMPRIERLTRENHELRDQVMMLIDQQKQMQEQMNRLRDRLSLYHNRQVSLNQGIGSHDDRIGTLEERVHEIGIDVIEIQNAMAPPNVNLGDDEDAPPAPGLGDEDALSDMSSDHESD